MRKELHLLFQFEAWVWFYHHMNILIMAVLSPFAFQNVFVLQNGNLWPYHNNRNANLFLSPGKEVTLFYALILSFPFISQRILQETCWKWLLLLCQNICFLVCSKICPRGLARLQAVLQQRHNHRGLRKNVSFLTKSLFLSCNPAQTVFYQAVKKQKPSVGGEEWLLQGA